MASEFREDLTLPVMEYLAGRAEFAYIYFIANDLLPEFVADDPDAAALAASIIVARVETPDGPLRRDFVRRSMRAFMAEPRLVDDE